MSRFTEAQIIGMIKEQGLVCPPLGFAGSTD
jgi:hypothetical protein